MGIFFPSVLCSSKLTLLGFLSVRAAPGGRSINLVENLSSRNSASHWFRPKKSDSCASRLQLKCQLVPLGGFEKQIEWLWSSHLISGRFSLLICRITLVCTFRFMLGLYAPLFDGFSRCQYRARYNGL